MNVLGVRCSNKDFSYAIMSGSQAAPKIVKTDTVPFPEGLKHFQSLKWLLQESEDLISNFNIYRIVLKRDEGRTKSAAFESRVEHEAAVTIAGANQGVQMIEKKGNSTISKDLGLKGRAHYLKTQLDTSRIPGFDNYSAKLRDAILAGWSGLN